MNIYDNRLQEAASMLEEVRKDCRKCFGSHEIYKIIFNYGMLRKKQEKPDLAEKYFLVSLHFQELAYGKKDSSFVDCLVHLAEIYQK